MVAAIITAGAGLIGILLTALSQWFGPRNQRQLMALELELLAKVKELEPGDSVQKQLLIVIEDRALNWAAYRSGPMLLLRVGIALFIFGAVYGELETYSVSPGDRTLTPLVMLAMGFVAVVLAVILSLLTLRRTKAKTRTHTKTEAKAKAKAKANTETETSTQASG